MLEGTIIQMSAIPNPKANTYIDCNFTSLIEVQAHNGKSEIPAKIAAILPAFRNRVSSPEASLKPGDKIQAEFISFNQAPTEVQQIQLADELGERNASYAFLNQTKQIKAWSLSHAPSREPTEQAGAGSTTKQVLPPPPNRSAIQQAAIDQEIKRIEGLLAKNGGDWKAWFNRLNPIRDNLYAIKERPYFGEAHSVQSFRCLNTHFNPDSVRDQHMIEALVELEESVRRQGVDLILCPFPDRDLVAINAMAPELRPPDGVWTPYRLRRNLELLKRGVEVIDATSSFFDPPSGTHPLFYYEVSDDHPAGGAADLLAAAALDRLSAYPFLKPQPVSPFRFKWAPIPAPKRDHDVDAPFRLHHQGPVVRMQSNPAERPFDNDSSPLLLIGDSFLRSPNGGLWHLLCHQLGTNCMTFVRTGGALQMPRHLQRTQPKLWQGRKVALFVFGEKYLNIVRSHWVRIAAEQTQQLDFNRLRAKGDVLYRFNDPHDFALLPIREGYPGMVIDPKKLYFPYAAVEYHVDLPPKRYTANKPLLVHFVVLSRQAQTVFLELDGQTAGEVHFTKHENHANAVLFPKKDTKTLTLKLPVNAGNFFLRSLEVFASEEQ